MSDEAMAAAKSKAETAWSLGVLAFRSIFFSKGGCFFFAFFFFFKLTIFLGGKQTDFFLKRFYYGDSFLDMVVVFFTLWTIVKMFPFLPLLSSVSFMVKSSRGGKGEDGWLEGEVWILRNRKVPLLVQWKSAEGKVLFGSFWFNADGVRKSCELAVSKVEKLSKKKSFTTSKQAAAEASVPCAVRPSRAARFAGKGKTGLQKGG